MKLFISLLLVTAFCMDASGQHPAPDINTKKIKTYQSVAWTCFLSGFGLQITGAALGGLNTRYANKSNSSEKTGAAFFIAGCGLMLVSAPFFIVLKQHKKRENQLSLKNQAVTIIRGGKFTPQLIPSLTLSIGLGK